MRLIEYVLCGALYLLCVAAIVYAVVLLKKINNIVSALKAKMEDKNDP